MFAVAEAFDALAITDDHDATRVARNHGLTVRGCLWMLAAWCCDDKLTEYAAGHIVDDLRATGARLPCSGTEFPEWARASRLLP